MKSLLLALTACAALAGCAAYPVYEPAYYVVPQPGIQSPAPGVYAAPPVYTYPYPGAYGSGYPYGYYGAPWFPSLWISGNYWCCSGGHAHRGYHGGRGGPGGHGGHGGRR
jgi:hypothetical protein